MAGKLLTTLLCLQHTTTVLSQAVTPAPTDPDTVVCGPVPVTVTGDYNDDIIVFTVYVPTDMGDMTIDATASTATDSNGDDASSLIGIEVETPDGDIVGEADVGDVYPDFLILGIENIDNGTYSVYYFVGPGFPPPTGSTGTFTITFTCATNAPTNSPTTVPTTMPTNVPTLEPTLPTMAPTVVYVNDTDSDDTDDSISIDTDDSVSDDDDDSDSDTLSDSESANESESDSVSGDSDSDSDEGTSSPTSKPTGDPTERPTNEPTVAFKVVTSSPTPKPVNVQVIRGRGQTARRSSGSGSDSSDSSEEWNSARQQLRHREDVLHAQVSRGGVANVMGMEYLEIDPDGSTIATMWAAVIAVMCLVTGLCVYCLSRRGNGKDDECWNGCGCICGVGHQSEHDYR